MADDLAQLEKDVEATRARLSGHLATLRSPDTYSEFADGIKQTALDTKDSLVEQARTRTRSAIDEFVDSLKARAAANPAAVLVIGAGLAWHLIRKPPVVTALVGGGLISLLKTPAAPAHRSDGEYLDEAKANLRSQANDMARAAADAGHRAADYATAKAGELGQQAMAAATDLSHQTAAAATQMSQQAMAAAKAKTAELTSHAREAIDTARDMVSGGTAAGYAADPNEAYFQEDVGLPPVGYRQDSGISWDRLLLGAAGVAVAASLLTALRSRSTETNEDVGDAEARDDVEVYRESESLSQAPQVGMM